MKNKTGLNLVAATVALLLSSAAASLSAADLPALTSVSMRVQPLVALISSGKTLSLDVNTTGIDGLGVQTPLSVIGAPEGTSIQVTPLTGQRAAVSLVFPQDAAKGKYTLSVQAGSPAPLVEQKVELSIGE